MRRTVITLLCVGAAFACPLGTSQAGWLRFEDASDRASIMSLAKDKNFRNKHEKKQAKKQKEKQTEENEEQARDNANAGNPAPAPTGGNTACKGDPNQNVLWGDYCYTGDKQ